MEYWPGSYLFVRLVLGWQGDRETTKAPQCDVQVQNEPDTDLPAPHWEPGATILVSPVRFRCAAPGFGASDHLAGLQAAAYGHTGLACQEPGFHDRFHPGERWNWVAETTRSEGLGDAAVRADDPIIEPRFGGGTGTSDPYGIAKAKRGCFDGDPVLWKPAYSAVLLGSGKYELADHRNST